MKKGKDRSKASLRTLLSFTGQHKSWLVIRIAGAIAQAAVDILLAYIIVHTIDAAVTANRGDLEYALSIMAGAVVLGLISNFINRYASGRLGALMVRDIRNRIVSHTQQVKVSYMDKNNSGQELSRLTNAVNTVQSFIENDLPSLIYQPLRFTGAIAYMVFINWKLLLFCIVVLPIMIGIAGIISSPIAKYTQKVQEHNAEMNSILQDCIGGIQILKAYNLKDILFRKYHSSVEKAVGSSLQIERRKSFITSVNVLIQLLPYVFCFMYGGYLSIHGQLTTGGLIGFIQLMNYIVQPAGVIPGVLTNLQSASGAASHIFEALAAEPERTGGTVSKNINEQIPVEFEDVSFYYNDGTKILDRISFQLERNTITALVGQSGGGKSTIIRLLCGFYEPVAGIIKLQGMDMNQWNLDEARSRISLVSQDIYLFPVSIAENISYGNPKSSLEEIINAAKAAGAHDFIMELPQGYETIVGERGSSLSGGQKQRISIARAIIAKSPIIMLDEPSSALDAETEASIVEKLMELSKDCTVLVAAHRLSTIKNAGKIIVLNAGSIAAAGTHDELLINCEIYKNMYTKQFENYRSTAGKTVEEVE